MDGTIHSLLKLSRGIDAVNYRFGIVANYLVLLSALLSAANAATFSGFMHFVRLLPLIAIFEMRGLVPRGPARPGKGTH